MLAQGQEWDGPVHADLSKVYGNGKVYVALTRAKSLCNLKISGVEPGYTGLRDKLRSSWRALHWLQKQGEVLPPSSARFVKQRKREYDAAFDDGASDARAARRAP